MSVHALVPLLLERILFLDLEVPPPTIRRPKCQSFDTVLSYWQGNRHIAICASKLFTWLVYSQYGIAHNTHNKRANCCVEHK